MLLDFEMYQGIHSNLPVQEMGLGPEVKKSVPLYFEKHSTKKV